MTAEQTSLPLPEPDRTLPGAEPSPSPDSTPNEAEALRQQLQEAQQRESEANRRLDQERQRLDSFLTQPQAPELPTPADITNIPDPVENPDGFRAYMAQQQKHQKDEFDRKLTETRQASEQANNANMLWSLFQQRYPAYSNLFDLARQAFNDVSASGMPGDTDQLLAAVKDRMDSLRGGPIESPTQPAANRTAGTSGGSTAAPKSASKPATPDFEDKSLSDSVLDWQAEHGLI